MKTRAEAAEYARNQLGHLPSRTIGGRYKHDKVHYGLQELRDLLDFIYGPPKDEQEHVYKLPFSLQANPAWVRTGE